MHSSVCNSPEQPSPNHNLEQLIIVAASRQLGGLSRWSIGE